MSCKRQVQLKVTLHFKLLLQGKQTICFTKLVRRGKNEVIIIIGPLSIIFFARNWRSKLLFLFMFIRDDTVNCETTYMAIAIQYATKQCERGLS